MVSQFICNQCGQCCSHIRGLLSKEDYEFLKENAYGKLPLIALKPIEEISFPLWDWEAKRFIASAETKEIEHKITPSRVIFDLNTNETIIVTYSINSDACTFLQDGKCQIYEDRGFICRLFPFQHGPFLRMDEPIKKENMFGSCPGINSIMQELNDTDQKKYIRELYSAFGDTFLAVVQSDLITEWVNSKIVYCLKNRLLRPALNYPYDKLIQRIEHSKKVDFTDFLTQVAVISKGDMKKILNRFEQFADAQEMLRKFL